MPKERSAIAKAAKPAILIRFPLLFSFISFKTAPPLLRPANYSLVLICLPARRLCQGQAKHLFYCVLAYLPVITGLYDFHNKMDLILGILISGICKFIKRYKVHAIHYLICLPLCFCLP